MGPIFVHEITALALGDGDGSSHGFREAVTVLAGLRDMHAKRPLPAKPYQRIPGMTNKAAQEYHGQELRAGSIAAGIPLSPDCCPHGHKLEGRDRWCPTCTRCY